VFSKVIASIAGYLGSHPSTFRVVADNATVMMWTAKPDKLCDWVNRAWLEFTGRSMEQQLGNGWAEGVHSDDLATCLSTYTEAFDDRKEFSVEYRLRRYDGEYRSVLDIGGPRFSPYGQFAGYIGTCIDVTESRSNRVESARRLHRTAEPSHPDYQNGDGPTGAEIRVALEQILSSGSFRTSPQLCAFLRFVVGATLRGESARLKGYTIAVSALRRPDDFDAATDPIVRVEAGRLRRALRQYYAGPGASDRIVIDLPRGGYIPTFAYRPTNDQR
jgi:PAS domain S-box-containing protein